ncbi:MAG: tetratricopeptide (TPR) repeat protein [Verrucomicrobiales bacterium]|jgi:tetratricopeptide (TPR) repeat protein
MLALTLFVGCGGDPNGKAAKRGLQAFDQGDYPAARKHLERALRDRADLREDAPLYNLLGLSCAHMGDTPASTNAYFKSLELEPKNFETSYNLGVALCEAGQLSDGARMLMHAASIRADDTRALEYLAWEYHHNGMSQQARSILLAAQQRSPESPQILTLLAITGLESEGAVYASSYLKEAIRSDAHYGPARFNLGVLHDLWLKDREGAIRHYRQFLKDGATGTQAEQAESAIARLEQAIASDYQKTPAEPGLKVYEDDPAPRPPLGAGPPAAAVATVATSAAPALDSIEGLLSFARQEVEDGNSSNALNLCLQAAAMASRTNDLKMEEKALRTAVALCTDLPRAHFAMGRHLNERGEYRQAMQAFQKAAEIEPEWAQAHLSAAAAGRACNEFQAALKSLRKAVEVAPDNPDALWSLGLFYQEQLKLPESAHRTFETFVSNFETDPRLADARQRLSDLDAPKSTAPVVTPTPDASSELPPVSLRHQMVNVETPEPEPGVTEASSTVVADRDQALNLFNEGAKQQARGDYDQAVLYYQNAITADPGYAPIYYNLGLIYQQRKQLENARNAYMKAAEYDDQLVNAHFNLALICRELGDDSRALSELNLVLSQRPDHVLSHFVLGQIYAAEAGKTTEARRHFNRFLTLAPNDPVAPEARRWLLQH